MPQAIENANKFGTRQMQDFAFFVLLQTSTKQDTLGLSYLNALIIHPNINLQ